MGAGLAARLDQARPEPLARQLEEPEARNAPDLDARAIALHRLADLALDGPHVAGLVHVDEVDHDEAGEVPEPELARDFLSRLEVGLERGLLDVALARRASRVDVDRDQRLGRVDHDVAARLELHHRAVHGVELVLDLIAEEQRDVAVAVGLDPFGMARHQQPHELLGCLIGIAAVDQDLLDLLGIEIADGALDQAGFLVDQGRRARLQGQLADLVPRAHQIVEVALDLRLVALHPGGSHDDPHAVGDLQLAQDLAQLAPRGCVGDLARDAAAARGVGHQHAIPAGQRDIGRQRRTLVAALLLYHLDQQDLTPLDDFLNVVTPGRPAATPLAAVGAFGYDGFGGDGLADDGLFRVRRVDRQGVAVVRVGAVVDRPRRHVGFGCADRFGHRGDGFVALLGVIGRVVDGLVRVVVVPDGRDLGVTYLVIAVVGLVIVIVEAAIDLVDMGLRRLGAALHLLVLGQQRLAVGDGDLVVVRVNLVERQESVAIAAEVDERRLQRRLDAGHLGEIDVALELLLGRGLDVVFVELVATGHDDANLFGMRAVNQHALGHIYSPTRSLAGPRELRFAGGSVPAGASATMSTRHCAAQL